MEMEIEDVPVPVGASSEGPATSFANWVKGPAFVLVVRGSAAIYGCEGAAPSFFTEEMARRYPLKTRFQRDVGELEGYFENFARRRGKRLRVFSCSAKLWRPACASMSPVFQ